MKMVKCPMCGKMFDTDEVGNYLTDKFGFEGYSEILHNVGDVCDSCGLGLYYADHEDEAD